VRGIDFRPRGLIQNPDIQRLLTRRLDIKQGAVAPTMAPELQGVIVVADLRDDPAQHQLTRVPYHFGGGQVAVAAQVGYLELTNPAGSGVLVRIKRFIASTTPGSDTFGFRWGFITSGNAPNQQGQSSDLVGHLGNQGVAKAQLRLSTQAAVLPSMGAIEALGVPCIVDFRDGEWVIPPLSIPRGFYIEATIPNHFAWYTLQWTEEPLPAPISG